MDKNPKHLNFAIVSLKITPSDSSLPWAGLYLNLRIVFASGEVKWILQKKYQKILFGK